MPTNVKILVKCADCYLYTDDGLIWKKYPRWYGALLTFWWRIRYGSSSRVEYSYKTKQKEG